MFKELELSLSPFRPCFGKAEQTQKRIRELGAEGRIIYDGNGVPDLNNVIERSILAARLGRPILNPHELTQQEKTLLVKRKAGESFSVLTIPDCDGVLVSPAHTAQEVLKGVLRREIEVRNIVDEVKERGKIGRKTALAFGRIIKASDLTLFWSSRFYLSDEALKGPLGGFYRQFQATISYCPFIDDDSVRRLEKFGRDKLVVVPNKPFGSAGEELAKLINEVDPDITYYIGSSERDRAAVETMLKKHPELARSFVFFDAGHFLL